MRRPGLRVHRVGMLALALAWGLGCGSERSGGPNDGSGAGSSGGGAAGASGLAGAGGFVARNNPPSGGGAGNGVGFGEAGSELLDAGASLGALDASYPDIRFPFDPERVVPDACASVSADATEGQRPMDIIIAIDNSGSMDSEIAEVQQRVNENFYDILETSGIDYRVIMVSRYGDLSAEIGGSNNPVHISPPLGGSTCPQSPPNDPCEPLTAPAHGKFFHYSADVESRDMWQKLLGGLFLPDELETSGANVRGGGDQFTPWPVQAPDGYDEFLREGSFKVIVGISDDDITGSELSPGPNGASWSFGSDAADDAQTFDDALRTISPEHFGAIGADRNYSYYAIVGLDTPGFVTVPPGDAVITTRCGAPDPLDGNTGVNAGTDHQELARLTGGLRYSSCRTTNYDPIFSAVAQAVVDGARVPCEFDIPEPSNGKLIDEEALTVTWEHTGGSEPIAKVDTCTGAGYRLDFTLPGGGTGTQPTRILLCADSCDDVQADATSKVRVDFGCIGQ